MDYARAKYLLGASIQNDRSLHGGREWISWDTFEDTICLDGNFTVEDLEAIIFWIRENRD